MKITVKYKYIYKCTSIHLLRFRFSVKIHFSRKRHVNVCIHLSLMRFNFKVNFEEIFEIYKDMNEMSILKNKTNWISTDWSTH